MAIAGAPDPGVAVPRAMLELAGEPVTLVWRNDAGGLTGRVDGDRPRYIKWNPAGSAESLAAEAERLEWLEGRHPAPVVLDFVADGGAELLVTEALPGRSAVDPYWVARLRDAIRAIAHGLRYLHDLPTEGCPFEWSVTSRLAGVPAQSAIANKSIGVAPSIDRLVVCHGDACAPNTLISDDGNFLANVDMGRLGVADRWADLAVATMSLSWNYADFDERVFWDAYGLEPDGARIEYYRDLYRVT